MLKMTFEIYFVLLREIKKQFMPGIIMVVKIDIYVTNEGLEWGAQILFRFKDQTLKIS